MTSLLLASANLARVRLGRGGGARLEKKKANEKKEEAGGGRSDIGESKERLGQKETRQG